MANRDVTLTIKVRDGEVTTATAKLNNLEKAAQNVGTSAGGVDKAAAAAAKRLGLSYDQYIQKVRMATTETSKLGSTVSNVASGPAPQAAKAIDQVKLAAAGAGEAAGGMGASLFAIVGVAAAVVIAIVAVVAITVKLADVIFDTTKKFAEYVIGIGKLSEETGLAAETVSALSLEAERQGRSFDILKGPLNEFRKNIGQAAAGSEEARAKMKLLGIDGTQAITNVDGAFRTAISTIVSLPSGLKQAQALFAAFGAEGYKLLPFLQELHGDVDAAIRKAEELGLLLSGKDVQAAKEFQKAYTDLQKVIQGITYLFGREFMPTVTQALRDFGGWLSENKATIKDWATVAGNFAKGVIGAFKEIIQFVNDHPVLSRILLGVATTGGSEVVIQQARTISGIGASQQSQPSTLPGQYTIDYSRPGSAPPDLAALDAARAEYEKKLKETVERNKRDWDAAIQLWEQSGQDAGTALTRIFTDLKTKFEISGDRAAFTQGVARATDAYLSTIAATYQQLEALEDERGKRNKITANEQALLDQQQFKRRQDWAQRQVDVVRQANDLVLKNEKKLSADQLRTAEEAMREKMELDDLRLKHDIENREYSLAHGIITEEQYLEFRKNADLAALESRKASLEKFLAAAKLSGARTKDIEGDIAQLTEEIAQQKIRNERAVTQEVENRAAVLREIARIERESADPVKSAQRRADAANREKLSLKQEIQALQDELASGGTNDHLIIQVALLRDIIDMRNRELDAVIRINRAQLELSHAMKISSNQIRAGVLEHLARQRDINQGIVDGINGTFDAIGARLDEQIDKMFEWAGVFQSLFAEPLKAFARNSLTKITRHLLDAFVPGLGSELTKTNNPIARPIVDELVEIKELLRKGLVGGAVPGGGTSSLAGLLGGLGGSAGGGVRSGGIFGSGGLLSRLLGSRTGTISGTGNDEAYNVDGRSIWGKLTGEGGIFARRGGSRLAGIAGGLGDIAAVAGGIIGGRWGGILQFGGMGASIGAGFGPVGAAIGAAIGAGVGILAGIFGGDPKRKRDKKEKIPELNKGFTDAIAELRKILADSQALRFSDPQEAVTQAQEVRAKIASGFGIQFESKKYRKQSQTMIAAKLREADPIIELIKQSAAIAAGAADRRQRILPEFAGGYFADFFRPNGLLPGMFDGRDNILAMISRGEMVLNPGQQNRVRALAGYDIFSGAGIPNYPNPSASPKLAVGGMAGAGLALSPQVVFQPNLTLFLTGLTSLDDRVSGYLQSDQGRRVQVKVIREEKEKKRI